MPTKKTSKVDTKSDSRPVAQPETTVALAPLVNESFTLAVAQVGNRRVGVELERVPIEINGQPYDIFSRHISLGAVRRFSRLATGKDNRADSGDAIFEFLKDHVRNEDGTPLFDDDSLSTIDLDFARDLTDALISFFGDSKSKKAP